MGREAAAPEGVIPGSEQDERARSRLLRAAVDIFGKKGYAAASVREIVEQAGVSKPALYYHFGSKDGVLGALLEEAARSFDETLAEALKRRGTAHSRLMGLCDDVVALFSQAVPLVRVAHSLCYAPAEGVSQFDCGVFERSLDAAVRQIVQDGVDSGELRAVPIGDMATAITGVFLGCSGRELRRSASPIGPNDLHRILDLVFEGLSATSGKLQREQGVPSR
jgi:TetR/AcrR family transcriptional regulator